MVEDRISKGILESRRGDGVSDLVKRGEGWPSPEQKREAEDMALAQAAYRMAKEDLDFGRFAFDPRVVLSRVRAKMKAS